MKGEKHMSNKIVYAVYFYGYNTEKSLGAFLIEADSIKEVSQLVNNLLEQKSFEIEMKRPNKRKIIFSDKVTSVKIEELNKKISESSYTIC